MRTVKGSKPHNGVPKIRGLSQTEPQGQGGALWGACAQTHDTSKNTNNKEVLVMLGDTLTHCYTRGKRCDQNPRVHKIISQPVCQRCYMRARYRTRFRPNKINRC